MRLLSVVVVAAVLVACTNKVVVVEAPPPHECAASFEGTWHVLDKVTEVSAPAGDCAAFESRTLDATLDAQLSKWNESNGATYATLSFGTCKTLLTEATQPRPDGMTFHFFRTLTVQDDGSLKGDLSVRLIASSELGPDAGNPLFAPATCTVKFETTAAR
jgi:hypothetical protein